MTLPRCHPDLNWPVVCITWATIRAPRKPSARADPAGPGATASTLDQAKSTMKTIQIFVRANDENTGETVENLRVATSIN